MGGALPKEKNGIPKNKIRCPKSDRKIAAVRIHRDFFGTN
jgi:hypothetical protein